VAQAAVADTRPLALLGRLVDESPSHACDVLSITKNVVKATPDNPLRLVLTTDQENLIRYRAQTEDLVPSDFTDRVLEAARPMANSTLVESADTACYVAQNA
jgi:uncharacterized protein (DUF1778 family)